MDQHAPLLIPYLMSRSILITGINGFMGPFLAELLSLDQSQIIGLDSAPFSSRLNFIHPVQGDLLDQNLIERLLKKFKVQEIYHLAGLSRGEDPSAFEQANVLATQNLLRAATRAGTVKKVLLVSSSAVYGTPMQIEKPIIEDSPLNPVTAYGQSKKKIEELATQFLDLELFLVRPFNAIGPGQSEQYFSAAVAKQIVEIEQGKRPPVIELWNTKTFRDFTDVRDIVRGMQDVLKKGKRGEIYNICSGRKTKLSEVVKTLISLSKLPEAIEIKSQEIVKDSDVLGQVGSFDKIYSHTGWKPEYSLERSLRDLLESKRST